MIDALLQQLFRSRVFKIKQRKQPIIYRTRNTLSQKSREAKKGQQ